MKDAELFVEFVKLVKRGRQLDSEGLDPRAAGELDGYVSRARAALGAPSRALPAFSPYHPRLAVRLSSILSS